MSADGPLPLSKGSMVNDYVIYRPISALGDGDCAWLSEIKLRTAVTADAEAHAYIEFDSMISISSFETKALIVVKAAFSWCNALDLSLLLHR